MQSRVGLLGLVLVLGSAPPGHAEVSDGTSAPAHADAPADAKNTPATGSRSPWALTGQLGAAAFLHSRSLALEHTVKGSAKLAALHTLVPRLEMGPALTGVMTPSTNYGVWALYARGRYQLYASSSFQLGIGLGLGVSHNAPILHRDLRADLPIVPYGSVEADCLWRLGDGLWLGPALSFEQLSVVHLSAALYWRD